MTVPIPERLPPDVVDGVEIVRPLRICDVCGQIDDHPRHVVGHDVNGPVPVNTALVVAISSRTDLSPEDKESIVADILDTTLEQRHMDCCVQAGCPDGSCAPNAITGLTGAELLAHITGEA